MPSKMSEKLKDYQVLDVLCGGTFYKVKHKVTKNVFAWKAYNCSAYSDEQIQNVVNEVKTLSRVLAANSENLLRYYDTILHGPSKTLYFVLEYNSWQSVKELIDSCHASEEYFCESFIWYLLLELAKACKFVENYNFIALQKCISLASIFVSENGDVRINCFEPRSAPCEGADLILQVGRVARAICYRTLDCNEEIKEFYYSDDLSDVVNFLTDDKNKKMRADVVLYHPTVLAYAATLARPAPLARGPAALQYARSSSQANKCDSQKVVELCTTIEALPRRHLDSALSPVYSNVSPKTKFSTDSEEVTVARGSLSPTLAALALELPGFVPRSRKPYSELCDGYGGPLKVSEETFSQQWMSRLIALRQRERSLNERERDLIAKEIVNSPSTKVVPLAGSPCNLKSNGITLPAVVTQVGEERSMWASRRRRRRPGSIRTRPRRKSYAYEDLDSSLSADAGDGSIIVTATKFTKENMPRRNIFPDTDNNAYFSARNPFVESDDSVTLTFYDLDHVNDGTAQRQSDQIEDEKVLKNIARFKYLDVDKLTSEKRSAKQWSHSPSKQAKIVGQIFADITNRGGLVNATPSKASLASQCSGSSPVGRSGAARPPGPPTPRPAPQLKKNKLRRSLLPFKTPFKLRSASTKV